MLTYALGRGLEYYDRCAVDKIVEALDAERLPVLRPGGRDRQERPVPEANRDRGANHDERRTDLAADGPARPRHGRRPALARGDDARAARRPRPRPRQAAAAADGVPLRPQRRAHGRLDARRPRGPASSCRPSSSRWPPFTGRPARPQRPDLRQGPAQRRRRRRPRPRRGGVPDRRPAAKTAGANIQAGVSVDQVAAAAARRPHPARRRSSWASNATAGPGNCDSGYSCVYEHTHLLAVADRRRCRRRSNPRLVFDRLFADRPQRPRPRSSANRAAGERPRLRARGRPAASNGQLGGSRPPEARRVPDRRPRARAADRPGRDAAAGRAARRTSSGPTGVPGRPDRSTSA